MLYIYFMQKRVFHAQTIFRYEDGLPFLRKEYLFHCLSKIVRSRSTPLSIYRMLDLYDSTFAKYRDKHF